MEKIMIENWVKNELGFITNGKEHFHIRNNEISSFSLAALPVPQKSHIELRFVLRKADVLEESVDHQKIGLMLEIV